MTTLRWTDDGKRSAAVCERDFTIDRQGKAIPGVVWQPLRVSGARPLVLMGHGGTGEKRSAKLKRMAEIFTTGYGWWAAAIDGPALAGGCEIALACDLIVASKQARFGVPEVKRSLVAAAGALFRLPRTLPRNVALEMIMTGDPISAERAYEFGMVNDLCEPGEAFDRALALAERITVNAPLAVRKSRELALHTLGTDEATGFKLSGEAMIELSQTEDFWEGPKAFIGKRDPVWKGK